MKLCMSRSKVLVGVTKLGEPPTSHRPFLAVVKCAPLDHVTDPLKRAGLVQCNTSTNSI
jgi:hypothetical protein